MAVEIVEQTFTVTAELVTEHLAADRQVLTTPAMIGLMELCIAGAESGAGWVTRFITVKHRAGLSAGKDLTVRVERLSATPMETTWKSSATAADGTLIGEGELVRTRAG